MASLNNPLELTQLTMEMMEVSPPKVVGEPHSLAEWCHILCNEEMPIFSNTALSVHNVLSDDRKGAMELASVILQDPNLTVKLLKISNSPNYNPSRQKMVTVSRAIIMIGSEIIRKLTLVCSFFESILSPVNKHQANVEIAEAIHAAVHAKAIAVAMKDPSPEEVFIATLLNHIGNISFWCFCGNQGERILALMNKGNCSREEAERQVLGFKLGDLGASLSSAWKLGGLIEEAIKPTSAINKNPRVGLVKLGYEITEALKDGVGSRKYEACIRKIEGLTKQSRNAIVENLASNTTAAAEIACQFGATDAAMLLESGQKRPVEVEEVSPIIDRKLLQFQISQDITSIISDQFDIYLLLKTVLEGIHRGIGMDRTIFSMLAPDKRSLKERLSLGWRKESLDNKFTFNISETPPNIFYHALHGSQAFWAKPVEHERLFTLRDINVVGKQECFIFPVLSNKKTIGLIYADRAVGKEPLIDEDFTVFKYFSQQVNIGLSIYRMQREASGNKEGGI